MLCLLALNIKTVFLWFIYMTPSVAFVVKDFNKFHVISCLWYRKVERTATGREQKKMEQKFIASNFSNVNSNEWWKKRSIVMLFHNSTPGPGEWWWIKMKTVIKIIIMLLRIKAGLEELFFDRYLVVRETSRVCSQLESNEKFIKFWTYFTFVVEHSLKLFFVIFCFKIRIDLRFQWWTVSKPIVTEYSNSITSHHLTIPARK